MIDQAEQYLRRRGFHVLRVRYHKGDMARIEVPLDDLPRFVDLELRGELAPDISCPWLQVRYARP